MGIKFEFQNLGVLEQASIELAPFTLVCGGNNCGKTYLAYAIYGFLRDADLRSNFFDLRPSLETLLKDWHCEIDLKTYLMDGSNYVWNASSKLNSLQLGETLAVPIARLKDTKMKVSFNEWDWKKDLFERTFLNNTRILLDLFLEIRKPAKSYMLSVTIKRKLKTKKIISKGSLASRLIEANLYHSLGDVLYPNVFMASCERTGAVIFNNELNFNKSRILEVIGKIIDKDNKKHTSEDYEMLNVLLNDGDYVRRYAKPVKDNVDFINQIPAIEKENSYLVKEYPEIITELDELVGGTFSIQDGNIAFRIGEMTSKEQGFLKMQETSSSVKSLVILAYYLKCVAQKNDLLMIDEPELNLHPSNQRKMARLLARLVNAGLNVFVTTHSDIIAKEINTLILLRKAGKDFAKKQGYQESELLKSSDVELYISERIQTKGKQNTTHVLKKMDKYKDGGLKFNLFDKNIFEMNEIQNKIWEYLSEQGE